MNINKKQVIDGQQAYTLTQNDVIIVKVKGSEEFKFKIPDNWQGSVTVSINGTLTEILPT